MNAAGLFLSLLLTAIPPLTEGQRTRLATAHDGRDHREEAFAALLENARAWSEGAGDAAVRLNPDIEVMITSPDDYRGDLCRIVGVIQQQTALPRPWEGASEWFLRNDAGRPIIVFITGLTGEQDVFRDGGRVMVYARFYKRIDAEARDGQVHRYAAFVGAHPVMMDASPRGAGAFPGVFALAILVIVGLAAVLIALLVLARRQGSRRIGAASFRAVRGDLPAVDEGEALPDDSAEALAELKRRSEADH
jgi:hypothetical protein